MKLKNNQLIILSALGTVIGGIAWLIDYSIYYTPTIEFDGPAGLGLLIFLIAGWLVFSMIGLALYMRKRSSKLALKAMVTVLVTGLIVGFCTGVMLASYARYHFAGVSSYHEKL